MLKSVFSIVANDLEKVVIKVDAKDSLTVAMNPYVKSSYDYITVTKGSDHILTVIKESGDTFSFHWGSSGYTLICDELEMLKRKVVEFLDRENVPIELNFNTVTSVEVYYNRYLNHYAVMIYGVDKFGDKVNAYWPVRECTSMKEAQIKAMMLINNLGKFSNKYSKEDNHTIAYVL